DLDRAAVRRRLDGLHPRRAGDDLHRLRGRDRARAGQGARSRGRAGELRAETGRRSGRRQRGGGGATPRRSGEGGLPRDAEASPMRVQLLTFAGCQNAEVVRETLRSALASTGIAVPVEEVDTNAPETPERLRGWGSPTILIDGVDVEGLEA